MSSVFRNLFAMGTRMDIVLPGINEETGDHIFSLIGTEIYRLEGLLSNYDRSSTLSKLNHAASQSPFFVDDELVELFDCLKRFHASTLGYFDPTITTTAWIEDIIFKKERCTSGLKGIITSHAEKSILFTIDGTSIDSGGFGKGYAMDKVKSILMNHNIYQAFISFGESSVMALGNHPYGEGWKISIPDIYSSESVIDVKLKNNSMSVSGNTPVNRSKYPDGHIINPLTGIKENKPGIVCVYGPSAFEAEVLSTSLFIAEKDEQKIILSNFPDYKAIWVSYNFDSRASVVTSNDPIGL